MLNKKTKDQILVEYNNRLVDFSRKCIEKIKSINNEINFCFPDSNVASIIVNDNKNMMEHLIFELKTLEKEPEVEID